MRLPGHICTGLLSPGPSSGLRIQQAHRKETCPYPIKDSPDLQPDGDLPTVSPDNLEPQEYLCSRLTSRLSPLRDRGLQADWAQTLSLPPSLLISQHAGSGHPAEPPTPGDQISRSLPAIASTSSQRKLLHPPEWPCSLLRVVQGLSLRGLALQGPCDNIWSYLWLLHWRRERGYRPPVGRAQGSY